VRFEEGHGNVSFATADIAHARSGREGDPRIVYTLLVLVRSSSTGTGAYGAPEHQHHRVASSSSAYHG